MHLLNNRLGRLTALIALGGAALYSQGTQTANITGTVVDAAGAPLAGVTVRLTSPALQGVRTYMTDASGKFIARLLPPGFYTVQYAKDGLETRKITEQLGIDQTFSPKVTLSKVGGAVVEVVAAAPAVDKTDVKTATNYRMDSVDQLPTVNRSMETVALLTPGVTTGVGGRVQVRGAMTSGNLYLLDGQNIADNAYNNRGLSVIEDSIEETQIVTGAMSAEYGDVDGGVINSITRSGSNEFSGSLRWELSNPQWNSVTPYQNRDTANILGETKTLSLSGPIIKDKLWFAGSYFTTKINTVGVIGGNLATGALDYSDPSLPGYGSGALGTNNDFSLGAGNGTGAGGYNSAYTGGRNEIRRQVKLTWAINQDHTLVGSYMRNAINDVNRNYAAGELRSLVPQISTSDFWNLTLRSAWTSNFTTEARFGRKNQMLSAGGSANGQSPIYSDDSGLFYNNGIFNNTDGGDNRGNRTLNLKASLFWNMAGSHQTDFGMDYYEGIRRARNEQSPTNLIYEAAGVNLATRSGIPTSIWVFTSTPGSAKSFSTGFYVNDKWSLDQHWNFQIGLRFDNYKAQNEGGARTAGASGISPRVGLKFDLFGDSKHIFGLSLARYNGKVLEGITNSVTGQGNPKEVDYNAYTANASFGAGFVSPNPLNDGNNVYYWNPADRLSFAALQNPALYDPTSIAYYNDPLLNVKLNSKMKAPTVDELQGSYAYSFNFGAYGDGYVKVTGVYKNWKNLLDVSVGNNGTVLDPTGKALYIKVWDNSSDAKRQYKGLELETQYNRNQWSYLGSVTWSSLKGNYEGEGANTPGRGETIHNYDVQDGVRYYDYNWTAPQGYLSGHVPVRIRITGSRMFTNAYGKSAIGLVYRFDSGSHYSNTRSITRRQLGGSSTIPDPNNPSGFLTNLSSQWGTSGTQYMDQTRGAGVYNAQAYLDLALTHDFPLFKVAGKDVTAFGKVVFTNVFNHQQQVTFNTTWSAASGAYPTALGSAWAQGGSFGKPTGAANYLAPDGLPNARKIIASAGFRF